VRSKPPIYGLLAEFREPTELVQAVRATRAAGFREIDAFTPFPIEEVSEALGEHENRLPFLVLVGGVLGGIFGYLLQYWTAVIDYPINVGGRPIHSWPAFLPITFECTVLGAALACVLGMLALNGLPTPYHPLFNVPRFALSSRDRFFLCIMSRDPMFDRQQTRGFLEQLAPRSLAEVEF
jgi:hypothetical protein